ncbi:asparagine synthetase B [Puteibacter caeruleilacunae]|nr:asparagine synthetase B [Puteibacter caeruleilacunae]
MKKVILFILLVSFYSKMAIAAYLFIPMDESQTNHLKAYGITYWALDRGNEVQWLLNYRGGSFMTAMDQTMESECLIRGIKYEIIADSKANAILSDIASPSQNMDAVSMQKAPKIAVYSPPNKQPWDDAVTLVLTYAEIPYDIIYDQEILDGKLKDYDWLHLHHEDFTGQYGKFYRSYQHQAWYQEEVRVNKSLAQQNGFLKVSEMKLYITQRIKEYIIKGGFLFAMCAATDTYDIALSAADCDICESMFDGDPADPKAQDKLDYSQTVAFKDFKIVANPLVYEFSDIDVSETRQVRPDQDYFTLFDFSAKWDPVPTMLTQNHQSVIKGFMGQTTAFNEKKLKSDVLILGENKSLNEARYIHGEIGKGFWTFYGGHDPEDYRHLVGDPPTDLNLYPNSPGYRLILNNVLFPAAKKKKLKT